MECLIRIAIAKYMNEHAAGNEGISVATIVTRLFDDNIEPHLPPSAKVGVCVCMCARSLQSTEQW